MTTERERRIIDEHLDPDKQNKRQRFCTYCGDPIEIDDCRTFCSTECFENFEEELEAAE
jgi:hypothetical protein